MACPGDSTIKVTAAILKNNDKILIAKRPKGDVFEGKWEFPGGKLEEGKTPEQCLIRELFEELGINTKIIRYLYTIPHAYPHKSIILLVFEVSIIGGELELHAHQEIRWVYPYDLQKYEFVEADKAVVKNLLGGDDVGI